VGEAPERADRASLGQAIADALRVEIVDGTIAPGDRLREVALAERFEVSRVPVREALQQLASEGYLVIQPRRGATVVVPSARVIRETLEVRNELEVFAARLAAARRGGEHRQHIRDVLDEAAAARAAGELDRLPGLIRAFHTAISDASGNSELVRLLATIRSQATWMYAVDVPGRTDESWQSHDEIGEAVLAGEVAAAEDAMRRDVERDLAVFDRMRAGEG